MRAWLAAGVEGGEDDVRGHHQRGPGGDATGEGQQVGLEELVA